MGKDYSRQIAEILLTLKYMNDNLHKIEDDLFSVSQKMSDQAPKDNTTFKHLVVIKLPEKKKERK